MASATPKPDMVTRARAAAAAAPDVTITDDDLMEEGWLAAYSEAYFELHPEDRPRPQRPASTLQTTISMDEYARAYYAKHPNAWREGQVWRGKAAHAD